MEYIIGVLVSLLVQFLKPRMGTDTVGTMLIVLMISFIGAGSYVLLSNTPFWATFVQVVTVSGAFYAFIIRQFQA